MQSAKIVWQYGSSDPNNAENLATIRQWWADLNGKKIHWRQRVLPGTVDASTLSWETQRFDESFVLTQPDLRGITLYWQKPDVAEARSFSPDRLELDQLRQQLYIFPKSQKEVVVRIEVADLAYQTLNLQTSQVQFMAESQTLSFRDEARRVEIKVALTPELLAQLKQQLG
jgi:hypothetical protein